MIFYGLSIQTSNPKIAFLLTGDNMKTRQGFKTERLKQITKRYYYGNRIIKRGNRMPV